MAKPTVSLLTPSTLASFEIGVMNWHSLSASPASPSASAKMVAKCLANGNGNGFPPFLPKEIEKIKDPCARTMARRIERVPVQISFSESEIMSSCVRPVIKGQANPVVLLHCFDSSCLEWSCSYPLLEKAGLETWAVDVLGWGFSDLERLPPCNVESKRDHLYELWRSHIKKPMILVGPSLGAAVAVDFTLQYPEAVEKLVLINACVYEKCIGDQVKISNMMAYLGVSLLKSLPLRLFANILAFNGISFTKNLDWTKVGQLHCLFPWWKEATVDFMRSGGYDLASSIKQVQQRTLIISGDEDRIISYKQAVRLHCELPNAIIRRIAEAGHLPHVDQPLSVAKLIANFALSDII